MTHLCPFTWIPNASTLPHLVSLVTHSLSTHSTPFLPHQPWAIPQSSVFTLNALPSHQQCPCVICPSCGCVYVIKIGLTRHQTSCTTHRQSLISKVPMLSALSSSPHSAWTWIESLNIIDVFHLGLPCPCSYHHIPYVLRVKVQHALCIPLVRLAVRPFNITTWHAFLFFHSWCLSFLPQGGEKGDQKTCAHLRRYVAGD
jgi:hypothetical protein